MYSKKKNEIMYLYDLTANIYDKRYEKDQLSLISAILKKLNFENKSYILDAGCGTALLFERILKKTVELIGVDISKKTLKIAKNRTKNSKNKQLIRADIDNLPFRDDIFQYVFFITVIQNIPNPKITLKKIKKVTKKGAFILITGLKKVYNIEDFRILLRKAGLSYFILKNKALKSHIAICNFSS
jgi:ubiquinone/menaquinone biosynthesis C-methylase UbiE